MVTGQVICEKEIDNIFIPLADGRKIELYNMTLVSECDSNLISLGQLKEIGITYHDNPTTMILMRYRKVITYTKRDRNLFTLELA